MTAPLVPSEVDLQDFAFMPLDVRRLRDSDMTTDESPEACWASVLLWSASWHQVPAASIPNSDQWIAKQAGYAARGKIDPAWKLVRAGAMRGWILCDDDRWYHPVVAEKALESWRSKLEHAHRKLCDRLRKENKARAEAKEPALRFPTFDEWNSTRAPSELSNYSVGTGPPSAGIPPESPLKGREGKGIEGKALKALPPAAATDPPTALPSPPPTADPPPPPNGVSERTRQLLAVQRAHDIPVDLQHAEAWASRNVTEAVLEKAVGLALEARHRDGSNQSLNAGFVDRFVVECSDPVYDMKAFETL